MKASRNRRTKRNASSGGSQVYLRDYCAIAKKMLENNATISDVAEELEVSPNVIRRWQKEHEEFAEACRLGRARPDRVVIDAVHQLAIGYEYEVEHLAIRNGKVTKEKRKISLPPNFTASKFWLSNCDMRDWSKKPEPSKEDIGSTKDDALREIAQELKGTVLRPKEIPDEFKRDEWWQSNRKDNE